MKINFSLIIGFVLLLNLSCKSSEEASNQEVPNSVIATFADENVTLNDLKTNFYRNENPQEIDSSAIREFYPSYIDYRLKLYEGYRQGYHRDSTIQAEFNEYASEIAYRYWIEHRIKNERINTFKKRFKNELKAFHILKELPEDALPQDTVEVYNTLYAVRDSLLNGATPQEMNERHSSKRNGNPGGGQLSWITGGSTIQPFENAIYSLQPGEISMPVRSQFGYHLIILQDKRPRTPQRLVKHIFVRKNEEETGLQKIQKAYDALEADSSWSEVLNIYTEDPSTKSRDGLLGWIGYGARFPTELIESAMTTDPDSAYSKPFEVSYGYHIMKVDSVRSFESEEQKEEFIIERLQQLNRLDPDHEDVFERIAAQSDLQINRSDFSSLTEQSGPSDDEIEFSSQKELIRFNDKSYTNEHFQKWLNQSSSVDEVMESGDLVKSYRNHIIKNNLVQFTKKRFPEFARQVDHFMEGLIVFKVNEEHIWNPEAVDRDELRAYYESNKSKYKKGKTFVYTGISASTDSLTNVIHQKMEAGLEINNISENFDVVTVYQDSVSNHQNPVFSTLEALQQGKFSEPVVVDGKEFIYFLNETRSERLLSFDEAFDMVFSDYQPIHEEKYLNQLKERYNLVLYSENLK